MDNEQVELDDEIRDWSLIKEYQWLHYKFCVSLD